MTENKFSYTIDLMEKFTIEIEENEIVSIKNNDTEHDLYNQEFEPEETGELIVQLIQSRVNSEMLVAEYESTVDKLNEEIESLLDKLKMAEEFIEENRGKLE